MCINILVGLMVCLLSASSALAQGLPDTGQTKCYNTSGAEITCPQPGDNFYGQDAEYVKARSYTYLGNGIVRDNVTGLEWQQDTAPGTYTWQEALDYCDGLSLGSHDDWRLPTLQELSSLVDSSRINPAIDPLFNTVASSYWSSNWDLFDFPYSWMVAIDTAGQVYSVEDNAYLSIRAVRGNPLPVNNFIDNADGTITDTSTGLIWQQATAPGTYTWPEALAYCEDLDFAGHTDWRLPDRTELQSIVDYSRIDPVIDPLFSTVASSYWSSTTCALNTSFAWYVIFSDYPVVSYGYVDDYNKSYGRYVRAVRSGQYILLGDLGYLCIENYHCDEGETCDEGVCVAPPECTDDSACDDDLFCTGVETCVREKCVAETNPCISQDLVCNEDVDQCVECLDDSHCSVGDRCVSNACVPRCELTIKYKPPLSVKLNKPKKLKLTITGAEGFDPNGIIDLGPFLALKPKVTY